MKPKLFSELIPWAETYLANTGHGSGTNYTTSQVAGLMAQFALEVLTDRSETPETPGEDYQDDSDSWSGGFADNH